jgi:hypothetical protein
MTTECGQSWSDDHESAVDRFSSLLAADPDEEIIHHFIVDNPFLLQVLIPPHSRPRLYSKIPFGSEFVSDFVAMVPRTIGPTYYLFELERPSHSLFTKAGDPSAALSHAFRQMLDWRQWIAEHGEYANAILPGIRNAIGVLVIGRRHSLSLEDRKRLAQFLIETRGAVDIVTYDRIIDTARFLVPLNTERFSGVTIGSLADLRRDHAWLEQLAAHSRMRHSD